MSEPKPTIAHAQQWSAALKRKTNLDASFLPWLLAHYQQAIQTQTLDAWLAELQQLRPTEQQGRQTEAEQLYIDLRLLRDRVFYVQYLREAMGLASPIETGHIMSTLAEKTLRIAYKYWFDALSSRHGHPYDAQTAEPLDMLVVAMGKWGGQELNVSSDIDFIVLYASEGQTNGPRPLSYHEFYTRLTQRILATLGQATVEGIVFRTDLRLRPDGDAGPLVWSLDGLHQYFIKQGREWERYAWVKARPIKMRDTHFLRRCTQKLHSIIRPFVYRQYLDFDTLLPLRNLRAQIRDDWQQTVRSRSHLDEHLNIKIGEGSIREIEFIVQLNQLIHGGHSPSLQQTNLHAAIGAQRQAGLIPASLATMLSQNYDFLRRIEHFLQFKDDSQTHILPTEPKHEEQLATLMGYPLDRFKQELAQRRQAISQAFKNAFRIVGVPQLAQSNKQLSPQNEQKHQEGPKPYNDHDVQSKQTKQEAPKQTKAHSNQAHTNLPPQHTADSTAGAEQVTNTHWQKLEKQFFHSQRAQRLNSKNKERIRLLAEQFRHEIIRHRYGPEIAPRIWHLIDQIAWRSAYLGLFEMYPETVQRCCKILVASPWAAQYLSQYPVVLHRLTRWDILMQPIRFEVVSQQLQNDLQACRLPDGKFDVEKQMNLMRDVQHQIIFQLLAQDLEGLFSVESLADQLSRLADYMLAHTLECTWQQVRSTYAQAPKEASFAVISYGKLGGKELGYASDLDLVFLYAGHTTAETESYVRLARRMINWLSTLTSSGRLYEIDIRLRPDGDAGLIAVSIDTFTQYQLHKAWTWEHQAITRARYTAGCPVIGRRFERLRGHILCQPRSAHKLKSDILGIRAKIHQGHPNPSADFDIKHDRGGMVDIEFITQYLVLYYAHRVPKLLRNLGNIALLEIASQAGLIPTALARPTIQSYRFYRRQQHALRLQGLPYARLPIEQAQPYRQPVLDLWRLIFEN